MSQITPTVAPESLELCPPQAGTCLGCGCTQGRACAGGCAWANADQTFCTACVRAIFQGPIEQAVVLLGRAPVDIARRIAGVLLPDRPNLAAPGAEVAEPPVVSVGPGGDFRRNISAAELAG